VYVKVVHLNSRSFSRGQVGSGVWEPVECEREGIVEEDVVDDVFFLLIFIFVDTVGV
jgi:hypothetical protein